MPWINEPKFTGIIKPEMEIIKTVTDVTIMSINDDIAKLERLCNVLETVQTIESSTAASSKDSE
jgi:hypothetical protein